MTYEEAQRMASRDLWLCIREEWGSIVFGICVVFVACTAAVQANAETPDADIKRVEIERMSFGDGVTVIHDNRRDVTCWVFDQSQKGGISCIPDWMLSKPAEVKP